jgi:hypothetical protein
MTSMSLKIEISINFILKISKYIFLILEKKVIYEIIIYVKNTYLIYVKSNILAIY